MIYIEFVCIVVPLLLMLFALESKAKINMVFMIIGIFMCLFISQINGMLQQFSPNNSYYYLTTNWTPMTEEFIKALPVVYYGLLISKERGRLISIGISVGIGFALLENIYILKMSMDEITLLWALSRGLGAGLMHGMCTASIGMGISFIPKGQKITVPTVFALVSAAAIFHAIFNTLIQSNYKYIGIVITIVTYSILMIMHIRNKKQKVSRETKIV